MNTITKIAAIILVAALTFTAAYAIYPLLVPSTGTYTNNELTADPATIEWGDVLQGTLTNRTILLTNTGTTDFADLTMTQASTSDITYTLTWDAEGFELLKDESLLCNFTLTITGGTYGAFQIDITIQE